MIIISISVIIFAKGINIICKIIVYDLMIRII